MTQLSSCVSLFVHTFALPFIHPGSVSRREFIDWTSVTAESDSSGSRWIGVAHRPKEVDVVSPGGASGMFGAVSPPSKVSSFSALCGFAFFKEAF